MNEIEIEIEYEIEYENSETLFPKSNHTEANIRVYLWFYAPNATTSKSRQLSKKLPRAVKACSSRQVICAK